jgi:uncharacterized membrane protein
MGAPNPGVRRPRLAAAFVAASCLWTGALVAVPFASARWPASRAVSASSASVYLAGTFLCHQRGERSFHPWGVRMPVCARCFGLYASASAGAVAGLIGIPWLLRVRARPDARTLRRLVFLAALPTAGVWLAEWIGWAQPSAAVRAGLAMPLGAAIGWLVTTAIGTEIEYTHTRG